MKIIVCVDNEYGMMFNNRRQSRDREVIHDIIHNIEGVLWIGEYSKELFVDFLDDADKSVEIRVDNDMLNKAKDEDWCFVEDISLTGHEDYVSEVIMYNWNKLYPADRYMNIDMDKFNMIDSKEIKGFSHDIILRNVYVK